MNNEFLRQLPAEDQAMSDFLQSNVESIQVDPLFHTKLESQLKHSQNSHERSKGLRIKILTALGWAIVIIGAFLLLNWAVRSLVPNRQPAANGTQSSNLIFEENGILKSICTGQLAVVHGFSIFLSNPDKNGFVELDEQKNNGELRSFSWSPDGYQLAIVGNTKGSGNIYLVNTEENTIQPLLPDQALPFIRGIAWTADGNRLLTWEGGGNSTLYFVTKGETSLTEADLPVQFFETPQFAPDNEAILFYGADSSSSGLFQVSLDSPQVALISDLVEYESSFAWSPDGSRLAYIEMDRDLGEARLIVEGQGVKDTIATLPIPRGSGSSIPDSANLSWSPDGQTLVFEIGRNADDRTIYLANLDGTDPVKLAESAHAPAISEDGKCLAYIHNNQVFLLDLAKAALEKTPAEPVLLADLPTGRGIAEFKLDKLGWGAETPLAFDLQNRINSTPTPSGTEYDWRGTKLYLSATLPDTPVETSLYQLQPDQPATIESARTLAQHFGIQGEVYLAPGELPDSTNFMVTDGKQRLYVRSEKYFTYYADYVNYSTDMFSYQEPLGDKAQDYIDEFLKSHGFDFAYRVERAPQIINSYYVVPLSPDGLPMRFDYLLPVRIEIKLGGSGQVIYMQSNLIDYQQVGTFGLRTAEDAWQMVLSDYGGPGMQEGMRSGGVLEEYYWQRAYLENQLITIYGRAMYFPPAAAGGMPFVSIGDYTAAGNIAGIDALEANTLIKASGQFSTENGTRRFNVDSWEILDGMETSFMGTLRRDGENVILFADDHSQYPLPDVPPNVPVGPKSEQGELNVSGVLTQGQFEWSIIQYFPADSMHGGGGGGGGQGFYKLNLTGTPVPLPTMEKANEQSNGEYIVQEGDTLSSIAQVYGTTVDDLMQSNGLTEPTIFIGQTLIVPGALPEPSPVGQKIEGQRGIILVEIYRQSDGSQQKIYSLLSNMPNQYNYFRLSGDGLEGLEKYHNRPIDIWGTVESAGSNSLMEVHVDRFEIPFPDLQFQILRGTQEQTTLEGRTVTLFTTTDGQTYAQFSLEGNVSDFIVGNPGDEVLLEAMMVPGETFGGYPTLRVYSSGLAISPKNGQPMDMQVTADQPSVIDGPTPDEQYAAPPTATIEKVELVYYTPDPRYQPPGSAEGPVYIQPVWRFYGHYSEGSEFEILVQAVKDEFLLPEVETIEPPG
jgi:Tol biopolymer transport system component/LysM repeat protein